MKQSKLFNKFNLKDRISAKQFKEFEKRYETFSEIPLISGGFIANNNETTFNTVHIIKSQKNIRQKLNRKFLESYVCINDKYERIPWIWNVNPTSICASPSGNKLAIINKISGDAKKDENNKKSVIEIYDNQQLIHTIYPPSSSFADIHKIEPFYAISWNKNETLLAFIAEKEDEKSDNFFNKKTLITKYDDNAEKKDDDNDKLFGQSYEFKETFGEQMNGAKSTSLFIYDLNQKMLYSFDNDLPNNMVLSECLFDPNDSSSILATAYSTYPRRLGVRFYNTRPTQLWLIKLPQYIVGAESKYKQVKLINLAPNDYSPQYIRFSPNGKILTYLTTNNTLAHLAPARLQSIEWPPDDDYKVNIETIIDIPTKVTSQEVIENNEFGGIFCYGGVPQRCWINNKTMIINSLYGHIWGSLLIDIEKKTVEKFDQIKEIVDSFNDITNEICRDLTVLDIDISRGDILFMTSSIQRGHTANIYNINTKQIFNLTNTIDYGNKERNNDLIESMCNIKTQIINNKCDSKEDNEVYESILYVPPKDKTLTEFEKDPILLLYVHGGPHSANSLLFSYSMLTLLYCGFAILQVNYRGSIGISEHFTNCLHGNIGDMDVKDCINAFNYVCDNCDKFLGVKSSQNLKKIVMGGSHGGFLTGHLIGQYPNIFQCATSRNPVLHLLSMFGLSDIPDWILCECGINTSYNEQCLMKALTMNEMQIIHRKSPYYYIENVITPYQILCGTKDARVPMQQAIDYYKILKARNGNVNARLLIYPDCQHSLNDTIDQEYDAWSNVWAWFYYHIKNNDNYNNKDDKSEITNKIDDLLSSLSQT